MSINMAIISGRVGGDPETKRFQNGSQSATFSVATSERWKDKATGEQKEKTEWHRVIVWGDGLVDAIGKSLRKGMLVEIVGQIETRKWQDQQGNDRWSTEIVVKGFGHKVDWYDTVKREARQEPENRGQPSGGGVGVDDEITF